MTAMYAIQPPAFDDAVRALRLIIVRQSSVTAHSDLRTLLERTLSLYPFLPGCDEIGRLGIEPVLNPRTTDQHWTLPDGGAACLYEVDGTWVLLILGSAAARNAASTEIDQKNENAVVNLMSHVLSALRPVEVFIGPFDRVNRAHGYATKTLEAFKAANVEVLYLEDEPGEIWFDTEHAEQSWYSLSNSAATNCKVTVKRTTGGKVSMARRNLWFLGESSTPVGLTTDDANRLIVDQRDRAAVEVIVKGFAAGDTDAAIARRLVQQGLLRRRKTMRKSTQGSAVFILDQNEHNRVQRAVRLFRGRMLDLAMGKHVMEVTEPASTNFTHRGVRREKSARNLWQHVLVWDVPDIFDHVNQADLDAALITTARKRIRAGKRASLWVHEREQRERIQADLTAPVDSQDARETAKRNQLTLEMSRPIGSGPEHSRSARVREILSLVTGEEPRSNSNTSIPESARLFSGYSAWSQEDGTEFKIACHLGDTYAVLRRTSDSQLKPTESLNRAWGIASGSKGVMKHAVAQIRCQTFHAAIADAAASHIDQGVSVLSGQRAAASGIIQAGQHLQTERTLRRQRLVQNLDAARREVRSAESRVRLLTDYGQAQSNSPGGAEDAWQAVNEDVQRAALREEVQARAREKRLQEDLTCLHDEASATLPEVMPDLDDLDLALRTLVALRTRVTARSEQVRAIQALIPRMRVIGVTAFEVEFEIDLLLPTTSETSLPVGPIRFTVPTAGVRPPGYESWSHAECEELAYRRLTMEDTKATRHGASLVNDGLAAKSYVAYHAAQHLISRGLTQGQARYLLQTTLLLPRTVTYNLAQGIPIDHHELGTSEAYVEVIRRTYLQPNSTFPFRAPMLSSRTEMQRLLNAIRNSSLPYWRPTEIADHLGLATDSDPKGRYQRARVWATLKRENLPHLLSRIDVSGLSRHGKRMKNLSGYVLQPCPHCAETGTPMPVDIVVWNAEVPGGLLCSTCLRTPAPDSITYPHAYRALLEVD
ncbi:hypothetical protein [Nocardioides piscis]|uniref:Uncharacterized protein n=1 Tax=Nocardioides piscis TaxID=2714938 RepID=A0A6G7YCW2_9ACTN|nr:hypothetical protein [Nocardioides piscis]QIK74744.1 hypothetical protein G7071_04200 [Nocardioides piscis]